MTNSSESFLDLSICSYSFLKGFLFYRIGFFYLCPIPNLEDQVPHWYYLKVGGSAIFPGNMCLFLIVFYYMQEVRQGYSFLVATWRFFIDRLLYILGYSRSCRSRFRLSMYYMRGPRPSLGEYCSLDNLLLLIDQCKAFYLSYSEKNHKREYTAIEWTEHFSKCTHINNIGILLKVKHDHWWRWI